MDDRALVLSGYCCRRLFTQHHRMRARDRMKQDLVISALQKKVITIRQPKSGPIQHSDREAKGLLAIIVNSSKPTVSINGKGNCYDNGMVETVSKINGSKLIWRAVFRSRKEVIMAIGEYIDDFYNPVRRHSALVINCQSNSKAKTAN